LTRGWRQLAWGGAVQWPSAWAQKRGQDAVKAGLHSESVVRHWKEYTQLASAVGAIVGTMGGALLAGWGGRRLAYIVLCLTSLVSVRYFYLGNETVDAKFLTTAFLAGAFSAAFYGWLPLYLPELFPTRVRATGQG